MKIMVRNMHLNRIMLEKLSVNIPKRLRPAQLMGLRLRQVDNNSSIQSYLYQQRIKNKEREQDDWTDTMSSKTRYK